MNIAGKAPVREIPAARPRRDTPPPGVFLMTNDFQTGGSERQIVTLARSLKSNAIRMELGCIHRRGPLMGGFQEVPEFPLGGSFVSGRALHSYIALARHLRARKFAIAHSFDFYSNLMLIPTARVAGVPVVIGSHRQIGDLLTPLQFGAQSAVFRLCDRVVCNSRAAAVRLIDSGLTADKIVVIPNAIPDELFEPAIPAIPREPGMLRVGMMARMNNACKNHPVFLRAAARLAQKLPNFEVLLVGDGPLRPSLEQLAAKLGLGNRARFLGERHDIPEVLASLDVSVLPSLTESSSNSILESMAAGVPVVTTRVGGNPELISDGRTGLLVPPDNVERLAEALELFLTQPGLRAECARRARSVAQTNFSLAQSCRLYEELYRSLLPAELRRISARQLPGQSRNGSRRTRVAIVAASPRWIGGQGVQAETLIRNWQNDPEIEARFIPIDPEFPRGLAWAERIPALRTALRTPLYLRALWQGLEEVDVFHIFSASYWSFLLAPAPAWLMARLRGTRTIINYHSAEARDHLSRWRTALPILRRADRIIVPSQYLADVFREFGLEAEVVPNVVDTNQFRFRHRGPLRPFLVCTRGFGAYYSVDLVVRAFARVKEVYPEARLALAGKGSEEGAIRKLVRELNLGDVEFAGPVARDKIGEYYDQADIFLNASWLDNMPISILEAFASGTPVVSTAPDGIRYLVQNERTGLLCAIGDWQALAENVIRLLREPELASRLAQNAHVESSRYHWTAVRSQWLEVYRSLFSAPAPKESAEGRAREQPSSLPISSRGFELARSKQAERF
jgi:glycosyltransferase involved in cell wall biosynthesis